MAESKLRVCIVGTGNISKRHLEAWKKQEDAEIVAACDISKAVVKEYAKTHGIPNWFTDYAEALRMEEVDACSICTPAGTHADISVCAAENGKHILCEKPMALSLADCDRMIEAARSNKVKFQIGQMERFSKQTARLRELITGGAIGRPVLVVQCNAGFNPQPVFHSKSGNGGPIVDGCVHAFDSWRVIFDADPVRVMARGHTWAHHREELADLADPAPDAVGAVVEYASGDACLLTACNSLPAAAAAKTPLRVMEFLGPMGRIIGGVRSDITVIDKDGNTQTFPRDDGQSWFDAEVRHFADCIAGDKEPSPSGEDGKTAVHVALAILESVETGEAVSLR